MLICLCKYIAVVWSVDVVPSIVLSNESYMVPLMQGTYFSEAMLTESGFLTTAMETAIKLKL